MASVYSRPIPSFICYQTGILLYFTVLLYGPQKMHLIISLLKRNQQFRNYHAKGNNLNLCYFILLGLCFENRCFSIWVLKMGFNKCNKHAKNYAGLPVVKKKKSRNQFNCSFNYNTEKSGCPGIQIQRHLNIFNWCILKY